MWFQALSLSLFLFFSVVYHTHRFIICSLPMASKRTRGPKGTKPREKKGKIGDCQRSYPRSFGNGPRGIEPDIEGEPPEYGT